jgi:hypothetical protein
LVLLQLSVSLCVFRAPLQVVGAGGQRHTDDFATAAEASLQTALPPFGWRRFWREQVLSQ